MTHRGVYRDGVIVPGGSLDLPEGARIDFDILRPAAIPAARKGATRSASRSSKKRAEDRVSAFMRGFGILRGNQDWKGKSTSNVARELRSAALGNWGAARRG